MATPPIEPAEAAERTFLARFLERYERRAVLALLLIGVVLRLMPILWGSLHFNSNQLTFHPDEPKLVRHIDDFPGSLTGYHDYRYPSLLPFAYGALWAPVGEVFGLSDPAPSSPGTPSYEAALLFGRGLNVLFFGLGGLLLIWGFTRLCFGKGPALMALAAANCMGRPLLSTPLVLPDVPSAVLLFACFYLLALAERRGRLTYRSMAIVGAVLGMAVATKYTPAVGAVGVVGVLGHAWVTKSLDARRAIRLAAVAGGSALAVFLLFVPGVIFHTQKVIASLTYEYRHKLQTEGFTLEFVPDAFLRCYPLPILLATALGLFLGPRLWRSISARKSVVLPAAGVVLALYILLHLRSFRVDYAVILFPFVAMFAGVGLWGIGRLPSRGAGSLVVIGILLLGMFQAARWGVVRYTGDTNYRFEAWIKENLPPGPIGLAPWPSFKANGPAAPEGYEFVKVGSFPEHLFVFGRNRDGALGFLEDPEGMHRKMLKRWGADRTERFFSTEPGRRRFGMLQEQDLRFYEDLFLGQRRRWKYDLLVEFAPIDSPLDKPGFWMGIYKRVGAPPR